MARRMSLIEIRGLSTVFGPDPQRALADVRAGMGKAELLARRGHTLALHDVNLQVEAGEIFVVMGMSGSGKSTLVRHVNRLVEPSAGRVWVDGQDVTAMRPPQLLELRRRRLAMVFQRFGLLAHRCVLDNVALGLELRGVPLAERQAQARGWIERVGLSGFEEHLPAQLSGGMQQRVGAPAPTSSSWTNPSPRSTRCCVRNCRASCWRCRPAWAARWCSSRTTWTRPCASAAAWPCCATAACCRWARRGSCC
jgi:ABC-type proline/glycine betaine transport system ATPase subunit